MKLPGRYSLLWKLVFLLAILCLLVVALHVDVGRWIYDATSRLPAPAQKVLMEYAQQAEQAWRQDGAVGVDAFLEEFIAREQVWAVVVDKSRHSLSSHPLSERDAQRLNFIRQLNWSLGKPGSMPTFHIPFSDASGSFVLELPHRFDPRKQREMWDFLLQRVLPTVLAVILGILLYRFFISPLAILRRQANALSEGNLEARVGGVVSQRKDELGDLARAFDNMSDRLSGIVIFQRHLLRDLSHELRTPLSRLRVAGENEQNLDLLKARLEREVRGMEQLVHNILELAWLDAERPGLPLEPVDVARLWDVLRENASFESGFPLENMPCDLPQECRVLGNLNGLAQAMENILRNAIRHSRPGDMVRFGGCREGACWLLWIEDQGPGVAEEHLETIFQPFSRLDKARPGDGGFGLGLSIARRMVVLQGGTLWAENANPGLRMNIRLKSA